MPQTRPWTHIPIQDCGEPLIDIPRARVALTQPHPYEALGAPYGEIEPFQLRESVLRRLLSVQDRLENEQPGWRLLIFDAYRPNAVQASMVDHSLKQLVKDRHLDPARLDARQQQALEDEVLRFWAQPSDDPATPPAHSTGAAVDLTLRDASGKAVAMGSPIDELGERSSPDYYQRSGAPRAGEYHHNRCLLYKLMSHEGFVRHPNEWWHFSYGDQMWAWQEGEAHAIYGRADLVKS